MNSLKDVLRMPVACAIGFLTVGSGMAADVTFPNADGSGKILSPDAWGGEVPTTDRPKFSNSQNPTYYIDRDGTFNGMYFDISESSSFWGTRRYDLQFQNGAKLTLGNLMDVSGRWWDVGSWMSLNFKDGFIDFGGFSIRKTTVAHWLKMNFSNCTVTNLTYLWSGYKSNHDYLTITGSTVTVDSYMIPARTPDSGYTDVRMFVGGGSKVSAGQFMMSRTWNGGPVFKHTDGQPLVDVSGAGTELVLRGTKPPSSYSDFGDGLDGDAKNGYSFLTSLGSGEVFRIGGGAKVNVLNGYSFIGCKAGSNGRVIVEGEGSELNLKQLRFAHGGTDAAPGTNNFICVRDGGSLTAGGIWANGYGVGSNNGVICSNGTVSIVGPKDNCSKNRLTCRMQGDHPLVKFVANSGTEGAFLTWGQDWVFDIPEAGYQSGCVPFKFDSQQFLKTEADSSGLTCQINGLQAFFDDMVAKGERSREVVLMSGMNFASWGEYSDAKFREAVARWNDELQSGLPEHCKAQLSIVGKTVVLKVKQVMGLVLIFR